MEKRIGIIKLDLNELLDYLVDNSCFGFEKYEEFKENLLLILPFLNIDGDLDNEIKKMWNDVQKYMVYEENWGELDLVEIK